MTGREINIAQALASWSGTPVDGGPLADVQQRMDRAIAAHRGYVVQLDPKTQRLLAWIEERKDGWWDVEVHAVVGAAAATTAPFQFKAAAAAWCYEQLADQRAVGRRMIIEGDGQHDPLCYVLYGSSSPPKKPS